MTKLLTNAELEEQRRKTAEVKDGLTTEELDAKIVELKKSANTRRSIKGIALLAGTMVATGAIGIEDTQYGREQRELKNKKIRTRSSINDKQFKEKRRKERQAKKAKRRNR